MGSLNRDRIRNFNANTAASGSMFNEFNNNNNSNVNNFNVQSSGAKFYPNSNLASGGEIGQPRIIHTSLFKSNNNNNNSNNRKLYPNTTGQTLYVKESRVC